MKVEEKSRIHMEKHIRCFIFNSFSMLFFLGCTASLNHCSIPQGLIQADSLFCTDWGLDHHLYTFSPEMSLNIFELISS